MNTKYKIEVSVIIPTTNRKEGVLECIDSVFGSTFKNIEIIVIDNASTDGTQEAIKEIHKKENNLTVIRSEMNIGAGGGRNLGAKNSSGKYLLFIDSDNVIHEKMIEYLVGFFEKRRDCGMVGPLMLFKEDPSIIWLYFADLNMYTSQAKYKGFGEKNVGQYGEVVEVGHLPNCFMVRKDDFEKVGGFDEKYFIMFEEADLAEKIKKILMKKVFVYSKAITQHDFPMQDVEVSKNLGFRSALRAYLTARNRVYFMRRNTNLTQLLVFIVVFNPLILVYYLATLVKNKRIDLAWNYAKGTFVGFFL